MPIITKITTQQKNNQRYNIFTDEGSGEKFAFSIDEAVLIKYQLKKGMELDDFLLNEINFEDDIRKAYNLSIQYLARRMRSEKEVRSHLMEKSIDDPIINEVIIKLYDFQFLDDEQYAISYIRTQINTTDKGPVVIKRELIDRGISETFIEKALDEYTFDLQLKTAEKICAKLAANNSSKVSERALKNKIEQALIRKGFSFSIIAEAFDNVTLDRIKDENDAIKYQARKLERKYSQLSENEYLYKMKQALYRKGFTLEEIETYLNNKLC